jgi:hypothetical protein
MTESREPIAVIGTGYVGLVTAAGFAELGNEVWCVDIDQAKIDRLKRGEIPIYEPGLAESIAACADRLHFTTELAPALEHSRLLFVAVGTPPTYSGDADASSTGQESPTSRTSPVLSSSRRARHWRTSGTRTESSLATSAIGAGRRSVTSMSRSTRHCSGQTSRAPR